MPEPIDLLDVLKDGLPMPGRARSVVIVGAGIAGLTAGLLLKEAGHEVTILEARNRLGGRIYTYRGFAGKMYGEFGAMRFPRQHRLAQHLIHDRFRLATQPFGMEDQDTFVYLQGRAVRRSAFTATSFDFDLPDGEPGKDPATILKDAMQPLIDTVSRPDGWSTLIDQFDRYSLIGYLLERGVSEHALWLLGPLFNLEGRSTSRWSSGSPTGTTTYSATSSTSMRAPTRCRTPSRRSSWTRRGSVPRSTRSTRAAMRSRCATRTASGTRDP